MDQNINDSKWHILNSFLGKYYFRHTNFHIRPHVLVNIIRVFFNLRFSSRKQQSHQKLAKKITDFTIQFGSNNLTHFTSLNSLDIENNMLMQHSQKPFLLYKFFSKHIPILCQKKHLQWTVSWLPRPEFLRHFECKNLYIFLYISVRKLLFQTRSKIWTSRVRL